MAVLFEIAFTENLSFTITDTTDYTILAEDKTDLEITYPPITGVTLESLDLYDENVATAGLPFTYVVASEAQLTTLVDGVYKFRLVVLDVGSSEIGELTKYVVNDFVAQACLRTMINNNIDDPCAEKWCKIGLLQANLAVAKLRASGGFYTEAQEIMDYVTTLCNDGC